MLISYKRGQGSIVLRVKILNSSVSTGAGLTGLTSASSGLRIGTIADNEATTTAYTVAGSTIETITTLGTYAAPTATKCRFKEVDATSHPGVYEIHLADARFAVSSAKSLIVSISGATNCAETDVCIPLRDLDPYDAVRAGLTALPAFAAGANGGLPVLSSSATTLAYTVSTVTAVTGLTASDVGAIKAKTDNLPSDPADESLIIAATDAVMARLGAPAGASMSADIAAVKSDSSAIKTKTDQFVFTVANQVDANALSGGGGATAAQIAAAMFTSNTGQTYAGAHANSVVKQIADNAVGSGAGGGSISYTVTVNDASSNPLDGAELWVTTDSAGTNIIASGTTNALGQFTFQLDAGGYYLWVRHSGYNRDNPTAITVS